MSTKEIVEAVIALITVLGVSGLVVKLKGKNTKNVVKQKVKNGNNNIQANGNVNIKK